MAPQQLPHNFWLLLGCLAKKASCCRLYMSGQDPQHMHFFACMTRIFLWACKVLPAPVEGTQR